jgi:hypothetical protein
MTIGLPDSLALLSLQLALQIDRRLKGRPFDATVFTRFGTELSQVSGVKTEPQAAFLSSDPMAAEVFSEAIEETSNTTLSTIDDVALHTGRIVEQIERAEQLSKNDLLQLKAFCLAFHKSMMAQQLPMPYDQENSLDNELRFIG